MVLACSVLGSEEERSCLDGEYIIHMKINSWDVSAQGKERQSVDNLHSVCALKGRQPVTSSKEGNMISPAPVNEKERERG